jgi:hypothetical protein
MRMLAPVGLLLRILAGGLVLAVGLLGVLVLVVLFGGRGTYPAPPRTDAAIARHMPDFRYREAWEIGSDAQPAQVYAAFRSADWRDAPELRALLMAKELPARIQSGLGLGEWRARPLTLDSMIASRRLILLEDRPGEGLVLGTVARPWSLEENYTWVTPSGFSRFAEPNFAKAAVSIEAVPRTGGGTRLIVEWRAQPTDETAARNLSRFWFFAEQPLRMMARMGLPRVVRAAEGRPVR